MSRYRVTARGARRPVWEIDAPARKSALDRVAAATRMPRHCLVATFVPNHAAPPSCGASLARPPASPERSAP